MKRTFERISFMLIGAFIACVAYMVGTIDGNVKAREYQDPKLGNVIECDVLAVKEHIIVGGGIGSTNLSNKVRITGGDNLGGNITITGRIDPSIKNPIEIIMLSVEKDRSIITLKDQHATKFIGTPKP